MTRSSITIAIMAVAVVLTAAGDSWTEEGTGRNSEQERELVRRLYKSRDEYQISLERLRAYYVHTGDVQNQLWTEEELKQYHMIIKNPYILDMDLPSPDLKPDTNIAAANELFRGALEWKSKRTLYLSAERDQNLKRAELLFQKLIHEYPRSNKLDESCYHLGDIYASKPYVQYARAIAYYERVFLYEPNTNLDARLKAARLYETQINDKPRAMELYQEVLNREADATQTRDAKRRLDALIPNTAARQ